MRTGAVLYELAVGLLLLFAPWSSIWRENWFVWNAGSLKPWLMSGFVRGAVSGLGAAFLLSAMAQLLRLHFMEGVAERDETVHG